MAMTPAQEAQYAISNGVNRSDLSQGAQIEYDRIIADGYGTPQEQRPATKEERMRARQERHEENRRRWQEREERAAASTWLPNLGVAVRDGKVYQHGASQSGMASDIQASNERKLGMETKILGPLVGARAEVGGGKGGHRRSGNARVSDTALAVSALGPLGLLAGVSRTGFRGFAVVTFPDGTAWEKKFKDSASLIKAQSEAVRFNALAASQPAQGGTAIATERHSAMQAEGGVVAVLERLIAMHKSGALDDEEFRAAKAQIIARL
jgi:hypothetical protein